MPRDIFQYIQPSQYYVLLTFCMAVIFLRNKTRNNNLLLLILLVCSINEVLSTLLLYFGKDIGTLYSVSTFFHQSLWLLLLFTLIKNMKIFVAVFSTYFIFAATNFMLFEGSIAFNYSSFIIGAFLYLVAFIVASFRKLKEENFGFFQANSFLLISAPVIFFFGMSFLFGFKSSAISQSKIVGNISLYQFIVSFVNIIYYSLINIYIFSENKLKHGQ